jgi:hypothetical protein
VEHVPAKPPVDTLFDDVYSDRPWHLVEQAEEVEELQGRRPGTPPT